MEIYGVSPCITAFSSDTSPLRITAVPRDGSMPRYSLRSAFSFDPPISLKRLVPRSTIATAAITSPVRIRGRFFAKLLLSLRLPSLRTGLSRLAGLRPYPPRSSLSYRLALSLFLLSVSRVSRITLLTPDIQYFVRRNNSLV